MSGLAIEAKGLRKVYPAPDGGAGVVALNSIDLAIERGERVAITGPSGCGKSSLLNILGALDQPSEGHLSVFGDALGGLSIKGRALYRRRKVSFVFQQFHLIPSLTALENIALPLHYAGVSRAEQRARAEQALDKVGLSHRGEHFPTLLSGGEQQRVAVARALVSQAPLILADEPTGNLDQKNARDILALLEESLGDERTLLIVTHDPEVAALMGRRVALRDGAIESDEKNSLADEATEDER